MYLFALVTLLQLPLPSVPLPPDFTGGANIERLAIDLEGVIRGEMPDVPPPTFPLTGFGVQPAAITLEPGQAFQLEWTRTYAPFRPVKFRLWLNGAIIKNFSAADLTVVGGNVQGTLQTFTTNVGVIPPFTGDQLGAHTLALTAYDAATAGGTASTESKPEDMALPVTVGFTTPPPPPTGARVITIKLAQALDGTWRLISVVEEK